MTALLSVERLGVRYAERVVLERLTLEVARSEVVALMGLSGAGKTSALRAVAALQPFEAGRIEVDGFALAPGRVPPESRLAPLRRRVGLVFQSHALFEHLSALENVALAPDPPLLLMDEPTAALDPARRGGLGQILRRLAAGGRGLLVATHDAGFARAYADRVIILAQGVVVEVGPAGDVLERPVHDATRALLAGEG